MTSRDFDRAITTASIVVASQDQVSSDLAGETILLSLQTAMYYGLDQVGARIWELMREPVKVAEIRDTILREYQVDAEQCERDLLDLVRQLAAHGLIEVRDGAEGA